MKQTILSFLLYEESILLAMKKCGFGAGKWDGFGGKIEPGETLRESLARKKKGGRHLFLDIFVL